MPETPCGEALSTIASDSPSGDQDNPQTGNPPRSDIWVGSPGPFATSPNLRSAPPSAGIIQISEWFGTCGRNAVFRPSGDHAGAYSNAGELVSRSGVPASTSLT